MVHVEDLNNEHLIALTSLENVSSIEKKEQWLEVYLKHDLDNQVIVDYCQEKGIAVTKIDE